MLKALRSGGLVKSVLVALTIGVILGIGVLAGIQVATVPVVAEATDQTFYTVGEGSIGRTLQFTAQAEWGRTPIASAGLSGTVTTVSTGPGVAVTVESGDSIYSIDLSPVIIFAGTVPAFRDLAVGVEGADVAQLQTALSELGFPSGTVDGKFDAGVFSAVRRWQASSGLPVTGTVGVGQVSFLPVLPAEVSLDEGLVVGARVSAGDPALDLLDAAPQFSVPLDESQRDLIDLGSNAVIRGPSQTWPAVVSAVLEPLDPSDSSLRLALQGPDGAPVCQSSCADIPTSQVSDYPIDVTVIPEIQGVVIPTSIVVTDAAGATAVVMADGSRRPVIVIASDQGQTVVTGVIAGEQVVLPNG